MMYSKLFSYEFLIIQHLTCIIRDEINATSNAALLSEGQALNDVRAKLYIEVFSIK